MQTFFTIFLIVIGIGLVLVIAAFIAALIAEIRKKDNS